MIALQPITFAEASEFVRQRHRHHVPPPVWKFGMAVNDGEKVVGVAMVNRPVAIALDDGLTLEVIRGCTDGTKHVASMLYAACWRAAKALGYQRLVTYTLREETGVSLTAAGWRVVYHTKPNPNGWNMPGRPRVNKHPLGQKTLWEAA